MVFCICCTVQKNSDKAYAQTLPDIQIVEVRSDDKSYFLSKSYTFMGELQLSGISSGSTFRVVASLNGTEIYNDAVTNTSQDQQTFFTADVSFVEAGLNRLVFTADASNDIEENNEENNRVVLNLNVLEFETIARPNPFTPNNDGYNDSIVFTISDLFGATSPEVSIYTLKGKKVIDLPSTGNNTSTWDGYNERNERMSPGTYLYVVKVNGDVVQKGSILLAL